MKILTLITRILLGIAFLFFGLNGFFFFIKPGPMPPSPGTDFATILLNSHWSQIVAAIQIISAVFFLINRFVPLALTLIGPVLVNILLFHILLMPQGIAPGAVLTICWLIVFLAHRAAFTGIFAAKS